MPEKPARKPRAEPSKAIETILSIRCPDSDRERFLAAALAEGFSDRTAWILYHLRRQAKKSLDG